MKVCVALGSNLGDRVAQISTARDKLLALNDCSEISAQAALYESAPIDCPEGSRAFINTLIELNWSGELIELLRTGLEIEATMGRTRTVQNAPRPVDIDLICAGDQVVDLPELKLPHPRLHQRRFVLEPLAEICPELILPGHTQPVSELLSSVQDQALIIYQQDW